MVFELPVDLYHQYNACSGNGQSALLQSVRSSLQTTYRTSNIGADGQVIAIHFQDGITFEIVPVFTNQDRSYTYPNSNEGGSWKVTNPRPEIRAIRDRNAECNNNLVPLCRIMRAWKYIWDVPIGGLLIDTLVYQFIIGSQWKDRSYIYYDWLCRDLFRWIADQDPNQSFWKAPGSGQYVYGTGFQYKALRCHNIALEAIAYETADPKMEWSAKQRWRQIFGTAFPD